MSEARREKATVGQWVGGGGRRGGGEVKSGKLCESAVTGKRVFLHHIPSSDN